MKDRVDMIAKSRSKAPFSKTRLAEFLVLSIFTSVLIYIYTSTPLRRRLHDMLTDFSTRIHSIETLPKHVLIFDTSSFRQKYKDSSGDYAKYLAKTTADISSLNPKAILVALDPPYEQDLSPLADLARKNENIFLGINDIGGAQIAHEHIPLTLARAKQKIVSIDLQNYYRGRAVRSLPVFDVLSDDQGNFWSAKILGSHTLRDLEDTFRESLLVHNIGDQHSFHFSMNYFPPSLLPRVRSLAELEKIEDLSQRVVMVASLNFEPVSTSRPVPNYANTPYQGDGAPLEKGAHTVAIQAIGTENLLSGQWLRSLSTIYQSISYALIVLLCLYFWTLHPSWAILATILLWMVLLAGNAFLRSHFFYNLNLADLFVTTAIIAIFGSVRRMKVELKKRLILREALGSEREINELQDRFIAELNHVLREQNDWLHSRLQNLSSVDFLNIRNGDQIIKASLSASRELQDFLDGVDRLAQLMKSSDQSALLGERDVSEVAQFIDRTAFSLKEPCAEKNIQLVNSVSTELKLCFSHVVAEQVLLNLIVNCCKYCPAGTTVEIKAVFEPGKEILRIQVLDDGPGIAESEQDKIFAKFYRIKSDRNIDTKGHGLGLYLSKFFAKASGGDLVYVSDPARVGACFELIIPATSSLKTREPS